MQNDKIKKDDKERITFDAIVSNPPYQVSNKTSNVRVWQYFVKVANLCGAKWVSMIHPGSWVVPKTQTESVRDEMTEMGMTKFDLYNPSEMLFADTKIDGGITITNFKKGYKGPIQAYTKGVKSNEYSKDGLFAENEFEQEAIDKVINVYKDKKSINDRVLGKINCLNADLGYDKKKHIGFSKDSPTGMKNPIKIFGSTSIKARSSKTGWFYIEKDKLDEIPEKLLNTRKVMMAKLGQYGEVSRRAEIVDKNVTGIQLFFLPDKDDDYELKLIQSLLNTKTCRFILSLKMKGLYVCGLENVPDYTLFIDDMKDPKYNNKMFENKWGLITDEYLYNKFGFSKETQDYIEKRFIKKELV